MKSRLLFMVVFGLVGALTLHAADENAVLKQELSGGQVINVQSAPQPQPVKIITQQPVDAAPAQAPVYIIEKQPTTVVEDTPLKESRSDQLRKAREEVERQTEEKIVEKLETDRVKSEQERASKLMDAFDGKKVEPVPVVQQPVAPAPVSIVPPPAIIEVREEIKEIKKEEKKDRFYVAPKVGYSSYPSARNMSGGFAGGVSVGKLFDQKLAFELSFLYSKFDIETSTGVHYYDIRTGLYVPFITDMRQFNYSADLKYLFFNDSTFAPYVGAGLTYTHRSYEVDNLGTNYYYWSDAATSSALDVGLSTGVNVELSSKFSVGADFKYMFNLTYDLESQYQRSLLYPEPYNTKSVEEVDYFQFLLSAQLLF